MIDPSEIQLDPSDENQLLSVPKATNIDPNRTKQITIPTSKLPFFILIQQIIPRIPADKYYLLLQQEISLLPRIADKSTHWLLAQQMLQRFPAIEQMQRMRTRVRNDRDGVGAVPFGSIPLMNQHNLPKYIRTPGLHAPTRPTLD